MKCFLHIGTEKTGSTILQDWLYDNQEKFSSAGIYLSNNLGRTNNRLIPVFFQGFLDDWALENGIYNELEKDKYFEGFIERLKDEILTAEKNHHAFIITSEHLHSCLRKQEEIEKLYEFIENMFDDVEVICYFRDQLDVVISLYSTALKIDSSSSVVSFVEQAKPENYYFNYLKIADNWANVFGRKNCNFRLYDRSKFISNDIRLDFLSVIDSNFDSKNLNMDRTSSNESLHLLQSAAFRVINRYIPYYRISGKLYINKDNLHAKQKVLNIESLKVGKITIEKNELIRNRFVEINSLFFKKYFPMETSFQTSLSAPHSNLAFDDAKKAVEDALEFGLRLNTNTTSSLTDEQINSLRDIALRIYEFGGNFREDALTIMKIALTHRPQGSLIKNKVEQWSAILKVSKNQ